MSGAYFEFEEVDSFTTGAIGKPGARTFFLQARQGHTRVAVKCEKQQVSAIVQYLRTVLHDLPPADDRPVPDALELTEPVEQAFVLGPIGLGYDRTSDRLVVQLEEIAPVDEEGVTEEGHDGHIRLYVTRGQAAAFCDHADHVVAAGRPDCRWCSLPIDPDGHACPRMN
jgi:uncharacterized repeat protein (TIGR03847 family)